MQKAVHFLSRFSNLAWELLSPSHCLICRKIPEKAFCDDCWNAQKKLPQGSCDRCGIGEMENCEFCRWMRELDYLRSAYDYDGVAGAAVRIFKYERQMALAPFLRETIRALTLEVPEFDIIVPVPIHWSRRTERGFNQAELLCEGISELVDMNLLERVRPTPHQARMKGKERVMKLRGSFRAKPCTGKRVVIVDDIVTSGGTLEACAEALREAGARWVGGITYARELP
ncbi:MAG TPA: ComF family protein [Fimbriimonadales bacterium]|nr:ComF family protein [Fimbriimonadales bacterium]